MKLKIALFSVFISFSLSFSQTGYLTVDSKPEKASIFLDNKDIGKTPIELQTLPVGNYKMEVSKVNYEPQVINIKIKTNEIEKLTITLKPITGFTIKPGEVGDIRQAEGKLTIITEPSDANVEIDRKKVDEKTPFTVENIGAGTHKVVIEKYMGSPLNDILTIEKEVIIKPNETKLVKLDLNDYVQTGSLIVNSDATQGVALVSSLLTGKRSRKIKSYPYSDDILVGKYQISWYSNYRLRSRDDNFISSTPVNLKNDPNLYEDESNTSTLTIPTVLELLETPKTKNTLKKNKITHYHNKLKFKTLSKRLTELYLPYGKPYSLYKSLKDHHDFLSEEDYLDKKFTGLPERESYSVTQLKYNGYFTAGFILLGVGLLTATDQPDHPVTYLGISLGAASIIGGFIYGLKSRVKFRKIEKNIEENIRQKNIVLEEYKDKLSIWERDIVKINNKIKDKNDIIEMENSSLPEPFVKYK